MTEKRSWFERPLAALFILSGVTILSLFVILNSGERQESEGEIGCGIVLRHYGQDAREMESAAAIPLEDALSAIPGINRIVTMSENGQVRAYADFHQKRRRLRDSENDYYDAVREAAQRVYEMLPPSAQRPELSSHGDFRVPFWTAAVYAVGDNGAVSATGEESMPGGVLLERTIKPALNSIEGVGEVEIAGPGIREIIITVDQEKSAALGLSPAGISRVLGENDALFSGGFLRYNRLDIPVRVDGRYAQAGDLGEILIPLDSGAMVRLKDIADIREQEREAETLSRLNGKRTAVISVTAVSGADTGVLSRKIKEKMKTFSSLPLEFRTLEDRGAEESAAFRSVLTAALEASLLVALAAFFLRGRKLSGGAEYSGLRGGIICAAAIPLIAVISAAVLSAAGFPVNKKFLAGLAAGIGGAADAVILGAEGFGRAGNSREGRKILRGIWPPLVAGAFTTVAALFPLMGIGGGDIAIIAAALGTAAVVSVVLALTLLPPLFLWKREAESRKTVHFLRAGILKPRLIFALPKKIRRRFFRFFGRLVSLSQGKPLLFPLLSLFIFIAAIFALTLTGADTAAGWAEDSVYVQLEFEGGFLKHEGDILLASWAHEIKKHPAVVEVQTGARTGSGYGLVTFDPYRAESAELRDFIRSKAIPGAFVYIPEPSSDDRIWTITVSGDDSSKCREIAADAASLCSIPGMVKETVFNFKEGGPRLTLVPRRELIALGGMSFSFPADTVRRGVHGPVAYKRSGGGGETDVRLRFGPSKISGSGGAALNGDDVLNIPLARYGNSQNGLYVGSLTEAVKSREVSVIRRENRRRIASFSIRTNPGDPRFFRDKIKAAIKDIELPEGYRIEFDPEAVREAEALSGKFLNFIWAVLFCYMIIAAAEESFILPLVVLASVFPSLAIPVLILCLSGVSVNAAAACALVAVSGMTVNASVISAGELRRNGKRETRAVYRVLRSRIPVLIATAGTTVAGSLPFLFLREGNNALVRILAFVTVLGVGMSFFCSFTLVPSLMKFFLKSAWSGSTKTVFRVTGQ